MRWTYALSSDTKPSGIKMCFLLTHHFTVQPRKYVACNLLAMDLRLGIPNVCHGLQQRFQNTEYFTYDPLITL